MYALDTGVSPPVTMTTHSIDSCVVCVAPWTLCVTVHSRLIVVFEALFQTFN